MNRSPDYTDAAGTWSRNPGSRPSPGAHKLPFLLNKRFRELKEEIINKLSEYKKSIIYEIVTGKREV